MTFSSQKKRLKRTTAHRVHTHLPVTELKMASGADKTNRTSEKRKGKKQKQKTTKQKTQKKPQGKQQLSKSLFTAARATGTENKHQTVKNTPL